jgi:hypothetical protein
LSEITLSLLRERLAQGIFGAADGMQKRADALSTVPGQAFTVDGQPLSEIWDDLQMKLAAFNNQSSSVISLFSGDPTVASQTNTAVYATKGFEQATEYGRPRNIGLQYVTRAIPIDHYDLGFGYTQKFIDKAKGSEISSIQATVENAWWNLQLNGVLNSIYDNTPVADADGVVGTVLYNADETPPAYKRWTHAGSHTHYLADAGAFTQALALSMEEHLVHHGFGDFGEVFFLLLNRTDMALARAFTDWVPSASASQKEITAGPIVGAAPNASALSVFNVEGYLGKLNVVEMNDIPAGYPMAFASGGQFASSNVVRLRVHENVSARGLRLIEGPRQRYPLYDSVYDGYFGSAVAQRGAAVVLRTGNGTYAPPTFG